jgi:hypothetical protein
MTLLALCLAAGPLLLGVAYLCLWKRDRDALMGRRIEHPDDMNPYALERFY